MTKRFSRSLTALVLILSFILSACQAVVTPAPPPATSVSASATPIPTATVTPVPPKVLTICQGTEPQSLYLYDRSDRSMWNVLEALYDGPVDTNGFTSKPVLLQKLPTQADGDIALQPVAVKAGDEVVNSLGDLVTLKAGTALFPSGCTSSDCALTWDGKSELKLDQVQIKFKLIADVKWSDGQPLTADDSVFSYEVSADPATPVVKRQNDRTSAYTSLDAQTVQWVGVPGYVPADPAGLFWIPLPRHAYGAIKPADLLKSELATRKPLGWGPYILDEWTSGDHIRLVKNPNYFRAAEGLPKFDVLVFRFVSSQADGNLAALLNGECDVVDASLLIQSQYQAVRDLELNKKIKVFVGLGPEWEHLDFGIVPASYDDGYNPQAGDQPNFFGDVRVRQAFAYCMDRQGAVQAAFNSYAVVPPSYLPPNHPDYSEDLTKYEFSVEKGAKLLDEAGWKDDDGNPATPRKAVDVAGVPMGTPLVVDYLTTQSTVSRTYAETVAASLAKCGIGLNVKNLRPEELYAQAPDGVLFGRKFDLAQFAWSMGKEPPCYLYNTEEIPTATNNWMGTLHGGVNITGYTNPEYDQACRAAQSAGWNAAASVQKNQAVQKILARDLPMIPLFLYPKLVITRLDVCGIQPDTSARSLLWNLESFDSGPNCK